MSTVQILWARPDGFGERAFNALASVLDDDERARAARFAFEGDRKAFVAAHGLLRFALSRAATAPPHVWRFVRDAAGKPSISGAAFPALAFSLSHTRSLVACAVARRGALGLDVEEIVSFEPSAALLATCCTPEEIVRLQAEPPGRRAVEFTRLWTLKEAAAKALGTSLDVVLEHVEFEWNGTLRANRFLPGASARTWTFATVFPTERHVIGFARSMTEGGGSELVVREADDGWVTFGPLGQDT